MKHELILTRTLRGIALAIGLSMAAAGAHAQPLPPESEGSPAAVAGEDAQAPESAPRRRNSRGEIRPYLEVSQVLSVSDGETLTYTNVAAGVDGRIETRRVTAQMSYRYDRQIEWDGNLPDQDQHSGVAMVNAQVVPGLLSVEAGALATRTGGEGRALGVTQRDEAVNVYSAYAGPTLSTHAGPVAINASYRLGYVKIDDDRIAGGLDSDFDESVAHSATASVGIAPGRLPVGVTVGAGYAREDSGGRWDQRFEGAYVRADVVVPVSSTLAFTAGVGYEDIEASQNNVLRDANGIPVIDGNGRPAPDPSQPRLLTYNVEGAMYDAGVLWRPSPRTELQARAGHRYGGTTIVGSLSHQFSENAGVNAQVFDMVETFNRSLNNDLSHLPANFDVNRDPLTGGLGGCVFGGQGGNGVCLDRSLQAINGNSFRARGASVLFSGGRRLWSYGAGASYVNRRYHRPDGLGFDALSPTEDESFSLYGSVGRELSRTSEVNFDAFASWYSSDLAGLDDVTTLGATLSYNRSFLMERLQLQAALGLYNTDDGVDSATTASGLAGLRYTFY